MNIFLEDHQLEEIKPTSESEDKGLVITSEVGKRGEGVSDLQKEIIGIDTLDIGSARASSIHGIGQSSASKYSNGLDLNPDSRARILGIKNDIQDLAVVKLMDTLNLLDPSDAETPRDKIAIIAGLSKLVDVISPDKREGERSVHLHLYAPNQKKETDYNVIDV